MSELFVVLKVACNGEFQRVPIPIPCTLDAVLEALDKTSGQAGRAKAMYFDEDGDECTLVPASFTDFLTTAKPPLASTSEKDPRPILRLTVSAAAQSAQAQNPDGPCAGIEGHLYTVPAAEQRAPVSSSHSPGEGADADEGTEAKSEGGDSDWEKPDRVLHHAPADYADLEEELSALAEADRCRRACEHIVAAHLGCWLASAPPGSVRFEAWMAEVHPENCQGDAVDPRMYLEDSFHRRLWNAEAVSAPDVPPEERDGRFVPARTPVPQAEAEAGEG